MFDDLQIPPMEDFPSPDFDFTKLAELTPRQSRGRFGKGNKAAKRRRACIIPKDLRQAARNALTTKASRAIIKRLMKIAQGPDDAAAVAAASILCELSKETPQPKETTSP